MGIWKNIFHRFSKGSETIILTGPETDSPLSGCENTTENIEILSNFKEGIYTKTKTMSDIKTFQWIKGERAGDFVKWDGTIVQDGNLNFLQFEDGSRGNEELMNDFFIEVPSEHEPFYITEKMENKYAQDVQAMNGHLRNSHELKQQDSLPAPGNSQTATQPDNPIAKLLKDSKKTKSSIEISIVVDIPPIELMKVLSDSYDDGERRVLDYLSSSLNSEDIKKQIAHQIWINSFTKKKTKSTKVNEAI